MSQDEIGVHASEEVVTPEQEEDQPDVGKAVAIGIATLGIFVIGITFVVFVLRATGTSPSRLGPPLPKQTGQAEIGIVDQPLFENDRRLTQLQAQKRALLESYGWTDRDAGTVHMPVDRAIEDMLREQGRR